MEKNKEYLLREPIKNPNGTSKSPWHAVVSSAYPDLLALTNPNDVLMGRVTIDELIESSEVPLLSTRGEFVRLPQEVIGRVIGVVEISPTVQPPEQHVNCANPFEN